jgi:thioredoxin 1
MAGKVRIVKVNVDDNPNSAAKYGVRGIPTLLMFKDGEVVSNVTGARPKTALKSWIEGSL